jgi:fumarylpyruvate hydrolase
MGLVFDIEQPTIPVDGSDDAYAVRRIYCVGRNYAAHAREMGHDPDREPPFFFMKPVYGYCVGLDMTRRDVQAQAKEMRRPWDMGKGFDNSAPVTVIKTVADIGHPDQGAIWVKVNGEMKQEGDLNQHIWDVKETISYLSGLVELAPGDLIMMGTPAGVGPTPRGGKLEGHVDGVGDLTVTYGS